MGRRDEPRTDYPYGKFAARLDSRAHLRKGSLGRFEPTPLRRPVSASPSVSEPSTQHRARRVWDLLLSLAVSDFRSRYGRGKVRVLKWLLDPLAALGVYLVLIVVVLDRPGEAPGLSLACAVVPFQLVMMSFVNSLRCIELRRSIILNLSFPRSLIPPAAVLTESISFAAGMIIPFVMMAVYSVPPTPALLWLIPAVLITALLSLSVAYVGALLGIWFSDLLPFFVSFARATYFLAPGLIAYDQITGEGRELLPVNPLTGIFEMFRDALLYGRSPAAWEALVPIAASIVILVIAVPIYLRESPYLAKVVTGGR